MGGFKSDRARIFFSNTANSTSQRAPPLNSPSKPPSNSLPKSPHTPPDDNRDISWSDQQKSRLMISRYYSVVLKSPPESQWDGHSGTVPEIAKIFPDVHPKRIKRILQNTLAAEKKNHIQGRGKIDSTKVLT